MKIACPWHLAVIACFNVCTSYLHQCDLQEMHWVMLQNDKIPLLRSFYTKYSLHYAVFWSRQTSYGCSVVLENYENRKLKGLYAVLCISHHQI